MAEFDNYLSPGRKGHLIGIGGVSMSSLAEVLTGMGLAVTGSDMCEGANVRNLRGKGITVFIGHSGENLAPDVEFVVRTAAVHDDNPEIAAAHATGKEVQLEGCLEGVTTPIHPGAAKYFKEMGMEVPDNG